MRLRKLIHDVQWPVPFLYAAQLLNKTLGAWNRAMGSASASLEADELRERIEELEKLLKGTMDEVSRMHEEASLDPIAKCEPMSIQSPRHAASDSP